MAFYASESVDWHDSVAAQYINHQKSTSRSIFTALKGKNSDELLRLQFPVAWRFFLRTNIADLMKQSRTFQPQITEGELLEQMRRSYTRIAESRPVNPNDELLVQQYLQLLRKDTIENLYSKNIDTEVRNSRYQQFTRQPFFAGTFRLPILQSKRNSARYQPNTIMLQ